MFLQVYYIDDTTKKSSNKSILLLFGRVFCTVLIKAHNNDCIKQKKILGQKLACSFVPIIDWKGAVRNII